MKLTEANLSELCDLAITAGHRAATYIQAEVGRERDIIKKEGGSSLASQVVTEVDFESQRLVLDTLSSSIANFDLGLLTEESVDDSSRHRCDYFWCIDPLDGTLPFTEGKAGYSVSIALVRQDGCPIIGVIVDPVTGNIYRAVEGSGAFRNDQPFQLGTSNDRRLTLLMDRSFTKQSIYETLLERIREMAGSLGLNPLEIINQGGGALNACWVIENAPGIYFKFPMSRDGGGSLWDFAASACLFQEAGAVVSDIHGQSLELNRDGSTYMNANGIVYASSQELAQAIYGLYRDLRDQTD